MAYKKFLTSVADVYAYDENENEVFRAKTLLDSSIEVSLGSTPIRGGRGNQLQYIYYHTGEMKFTLTDTQFNMDFLSRTVGSSIDLDADSYYEEDVVFTSGSGTLTKTPLAFGGASTKYVFVTIAGATESQTISVTNTSVTGVKSSTGSDYSGTACVRYYVNTGTAKEILIKANMIPNVVKLVMEAQLNSSDVSTNKIGVVQIIAPSVVLSGAFSISMTSDGVSNTPLTGTALAHTDTGGSEVCSTEPYYARLVEIVSTENWYDNVASLWVSGGDFDLAPSATKTLAVYAVTFANTTFKVDNSKLTFSKTSGTSATIGTNTGLVTAEAAITGTTLFKIKITAKTSVETDVAVTVA